MGTGVEAGTSEFCTSPSLGKIGMIKPESLSLPFLGACNLCGHWLYSLHKMSKVERPWMFFKFESFRFLGSPEANMDWQLTCWDCEFPGPAPRSVSAGLWTQSWIWHKVGASSSSWQALKVSGLMEWMYRKTMMLANSVWDCLVHPQHHPKPKPNEMVFGTGLAQSIKEMRVFINWAESFKGRKVSNQGP